MPVDASPDVAHHYDRRSEPERDAATGVDAGATDRVRRTAVAAPARSRPGELEEVVRGLVGQPARRRPGRPRRRRRRGRGPDRRRPRGRLPPPTSSPRSSTTPTTGAGSPRRTRCPTSTRWAAAAGRGQPGRLAPRRAAAASCCRGAPGRLRRRAEAGCPVAGGHSIDDPEPKYGMAVTGLADPDRLLRNDAAVAGLPLTLTKPLGLGVLNNRHKATGEVFPHAVAVDGRAEPRRRRGAALAAGVARRHRRDGLRPARAPVQDGRAPAGSAPWSTRPRCRTSTVPATPCATASSPAARRNLDWVRPHLDAVASTRTSCSCWPTPRPRGGLLGRRGGAGLPGRRTHRRRLRHHRPLTRANPRRPSANPRPTRRRNPGPARINWPDEAEVGNSLHSRPKTAELILAKSRVAGVVET